MNDEYYIKILSNEIDSELVKSALKYYKELKQNFFLEQYEGTILDASKFAEVVFRILEYLTKGRYTSLNKDFRINELLKYLENLPQENYSDSIRILIPRITKSIYDIRSKRGATHIKEIDPNMMDATFVVSACDWIIAELIRLYHTGKPDEAVKIIHSLVEKKVPIIEEFDTDLQVLIPNLSVRKKILVILYKRHPNYVSINSLKKWIKTKSSTHISTALRQLAAESKIHPKGTDYIITKLGIKYVEENLPKYI